MDTQKYLERYYGILKERNLKKQKQSAYQKLYFDRKVEKERITLTCGGNLQLTPSFKLTLPNLKIYQEVHTQYKLEKKVLLHDLHRLKKDISLGYLRKGDRDVFQGLQQKLQRIEEKYNDTLLKFAEKHQKLEELRNTQETLQEEHQIENQRYYQQYLETQNSENLKKYLEHKNSFETAENPFYTKSIETVVQKNKNISYLVKTPILDRDILHHKPYELVILDKKTVSKKEDTVIKIHSRSRLLAGLVPQNLKHSFKDPDKDIEWKSILHYYYGHYFSDLPTREKIASLKTIKSVENLISKPLKKSVIHKDWEKKREEYLTQAYKLQLKAHPVLTKKLLQTNPSHRLVFQSDDTYLGSNSSNSQGQNMVGEILMTLRDTMLDDLQPKSKTFKKKILKKKTGGATKKNISWNQVDSNGNNLADQVIIWNDPSNTNWAEQFKRVLNAALPQNNTIGKPSKYFPKASVLQNLFSLSFNRFCN